MTNSQKSLLPLLFLLNLLNAAAQEDLQRARALKDRGESTLNQALYSDAIANSAECAELFSRLQEAAGETSCRTITGRAQAAQGHYPEAAAAYQRALAVARQNNLHEARIALLNNAGNVSYFMGRYDQAFRSYQEAESLLQNFTAEPWFARRELLTLANLATLYQRLGQYDKALRVYQKIRLLPGKLRPSEQGQVLENSGTLFRRLGDPYRAIQLYGQARKLFEASHDTASEISVTKNMGIALAFGLRRYQDAAPLFQSALELALKSGNKREVAQAQIYEAESLRRSGDRAAAKGFFENALADTRKIGDGEDEWKALYGLGQLAEAADEAGIAFGFYRQAIERIEQMRAGAGPPALRAGFLADKRDVYDGAIRLLLKQQPVPVAQVFRLLEQAKARSFQDVTPGAGLAVDLGSLQAKLPPGTMLLDYWCSEDQLAVVWVSGSGWGLMQNNTPERVWGEFVRQVSRKQTTRWRKLAAESSAAILPFAHLDAARLIVIPDGELQSLPFDLLTSPGSGGNRLLIEDYEISYLPTAALALAPHRGTSRWAAPWQTVFEGFADPLPASPGLEGDLYPSDRRGVLSSSAAEIESAASLLGGSSLLNSGAQNRKQTFLSDSVRARPVLHLATHAIADMDDPDRSRILFSPPAPGAPAEYLFAREIYSLNLRGLSLAVLSACDTEQGASFRGEGIQSFSRALLAAGASSSITTLWRVGDVSGKAFSDRLYAHLAKGQTAAASLRAAKLEFYRSGGELAHPFYWSVYTLNGDAGITVPRTVGWGALLAAALFLAALAISVQQRMGTRSQRPGQR